MRITIKWCGGLCHAGHLQALPPAHPAHAAKGETQSGHVQDDERDRRQVARVPRGQGEGVIKYLKKKQVDAVGGGFVSNGWTTPLNNSAPRAKIVKTIRGGQNSEQKIKSNYRFSLKKSAYKKGDLVLSSVGMVNKGKKRGSDSKEKTRETKKDCFKRSGWERITIRNTISLYHTRSRRQDPRWLSQ